ncbi:lipopolysaccharide assembly protein LapA domain-containing protein [Patescibacteria group bacterium]|nr:lipopolysaccharide assembly protein LapA domain-containing protein [Patescibacteria group bacterium]MCL5797406.1 lipopolysaccharide assembly protein LapA domain-containing protein [Patescibacteria group bacterium]
MIVLLVTIVFGLGFAYFATQNTLSVTIHISNFTFYGIPLYLVILGSLLVGIILATIIHIIDSLTNFLILRKKENTLKELKKTIAQLIKRVHQLELTSEKQKEENGDGETEDENSI